jgi:hypothetical protein
LAAAEGAFTAALLLWAAAPPFSAVQGGHRPPQLTPNRLRTGGHLNAWQCPPCPSFFISTDVGLHKLSLMVRLAPLEHIAKSRHCHRQP